jgi:hypothetical protein
LDGNMLDFALSYERLGWFVLPADPIEKKPLVKWAHRRDQRPTPDELRDWFCRFPDARIALATGAYSGFDVVDVDSAQALERLEAICGGLPETITQHTGREEGGWHFFFKHTAHGLKAHGDGFIDLRTTNDIIIVAPSKHKSARSYTWGTINPIEQGLVGLAEWPAELIEYFRKISGSRSIEGNGPRKPLTTAPVPVGERHQTLARLAGSWLRQGLNDELILLAARGWYGSLPEKTGFSVEELEAQTRDLINRYRKPGTPAKGGDQEKEKQADALVRIGKTAELFKAPDGKIWARFQAGGHLECWQVRSKGSGWRRWLVSQYLKEAGTAPSVTAVQAAIEALEAEAQFGAKSSPREVFTRIAGHDGAIYLDLADDAWRTVKIAPEGWSVVEAPPVCFRRTRGMLPLPEPVRGGSLRFLEGLVNLGDEKNRN